MNSFDINLAGDLLTVVPNTDDSYTILKGDDRVAVIYSIESADEGPKWKSDDQVDEMFVRQVGELIIEHNM